MASKAWLSWISFLYSYQVSISALCWISISYILSWQCNWQFHPHILSLENSYTDLKAAKLQRKPWILNVGCASIVLALVE